MTSAVSEGCTKSLPHLITRGLFEALLFVNVSWFVGFSGSTPQVQVRCPSRPPLLDKCCGAGMI